MVGFASALAAIHPDSRFRGVQRGAAPLRCYLSPKIEDPSQEEWGIQGVEKATCLTMAPFDIMRLFECERV